MSLAIKAQPRKLIDQGGSHGSKHSKLTGMTLNQQFDNLSLAMPLHLNEDEDLTFKKQEEGEKGEDEEVEEEVEGEEEDDEEEEFELEGEEEDDEEEEFELCEVCLKSTDHWTFDCPYLDRIPNPEEVTVGSGYDIACRRCYTLGGHPERPGWVGRAVMKSCGLCNTPASHWRSECPKNNKPRNHVSSELQITVG